MASVNKRPNGKYLVRWREYPGAPEKSRQFDRKVDADFFRDRVAGDLARGDYVDPNEGRRIIFGKFAEEYLAGQPWGQATRAGQSVIYETYIAPTFAKRQIGTIKASELQAWATGLKLAPSTTAGVVRQMKAIFKAAEKDRIVGRSPATDIAIAKQRRKLDPPLPHESVMAIAESIVPELRAAVLLAGVAGPRQGELFGITGDRIHWLKRELTIDRQMVTPRGHPPAFGPPKTGDSDRVVYLDDETMGMLGQHVERFGLGGDDGLLFHRNGDPLNRSAGYHAFVAAKKRAGVDRKGGWHLLRHYAASALISEGLSVTAVAATLGHSPAVCLKTYAAWFPDEADQVRSAMASSMWRRDRVDSQQLADQARTNGAHRGV